MKRFRFRLERLERLRKVRRREARAELAAALSTVRQSESAVAQRCRELDEAREAEPPEEHAGEVSWLVRQADWREGRRRLLDHAETERARALDEADLAAAAHTRQAREHRSLERLRERRLRRWRTAAEAEEHKFLDEIHLLRLAARRASGDAED